MKHSSYKFTHALCRQPGESVMHGLRADDVGDPEFGPFREAHARYVAALRATGAEVIVEPALEAFPDSVFVEDPALCLMGHAIILRPGAESRFGERAPAREALSRVFGVEHVIDLPKGGIVDGGDIMVTETEVLVGLSARTDATGVAALKPIVEALGLPLRILDMPDSILHFKTGCGLLDEETIFAIPELVASFAGYRVIECPDGEAPAANLIRFNEKVFVSAAYRRTQDLLDVAGYDVVAIDNSQAEKIDGGLSCMSLRFTLP
ncbi:MAG: dimethylarginine dimethylaminohydrolase [Pseudomonadota bacterium]